MTREQALQKLSSSSSHERFTAACALVQLASKEDISILKIAKRNESDHYVLKRLDAVIAKIDQDIISDVTQTPSLEIEEDHTLYIRAKMQAVEWVSGLLLHEIGPKLGLISLAAKAEISEYEVSRTKHHIQNLQEIFDAIEHLRKAATSPKYEKFDLAEHIQSIAQMEQPNNLIPISFVGQKPFIINSSKQLVLLALCNGIRNAIESTNAVMGPNKSPMPIVIVWGESDTEYWISVIDQGIGITDSQRNLFDMGKSTKKGHHGYGLAIARQALESLNGDVTLEPLPEGEVKYEIRWRIK